MLNNNKIQLMTKLASFEEGEGKEDIKLSKYYKRDYVRLKVIGTIFSVTIGYLLILLMIGIYHTEYLIREAVKLDYKMIGTYMLGIYIMILTVYICIAIIGYSMKFDASRKKLYGYDKRLKKLRDFYKAEEEQQK